MKKHFIYYFLGKRYYNDSIFQKTKHLTQAEKDKQPERFTLINSLAQKIDAQNYLEIGVRNPEDNFNKISISNKYSVDPGLEYKANPVDFKLTSDEFFAQLQENKLKLASDFKFDIIFIDGLHLAEQVERDIENAMKHVSESGFVILHDCNPPTEYHAREDYSFFNSPAKECWNGTTWKAFYKARASYYSCCIDSDWGLGILSKTEKAGFNKLELPLSNKFYEFSVLEKNRTKDLNLLSFDEFCAHVGHTNS